MIASELKSRAVTDFLIVGMFEILGHLKVGEPLSLNSADLKINSAAFTCSWMKVKYEIHEELFSMNLGRSQRNSSATHKGGFFCSIQVLMKVNL